MSDWGDPMTQHAMSDWASHLAEPSAKVLTSFSLLKKYEEDAVKVGWWNVQIQMEDLETRELEKRGSAGFGLTHHPEGLGRILARRVAQDHGSHYTKLFVTAVA